MPVNYSSILSDITMSFDIESDADLKKIYFDEDHRLQLFHLNMMYK